MANYMNITSSAVGQLICKLEEQSYIFRSINSENRREIIVQLDQKFCKNVLEEGL